MPKKSRNKRLPIRSAAALKYDEHKDKAPRIAALGFGHMADRILELANTHKIPIHKDPHLSNLLAQLDVGQFVPPELYQLVAEVLVFVYTLDSQKREQKIIRSTQSEENL